MTNFRYIVFSTTRSDYVSASFGIIQALRNTARAINLSTTYQWGHMGLCNCGFLAQEITHLRKEHIHAQAMQRHGDWNEQLNDYCSTAVSGEALVKRSGSREDRKKKPGARSQKSEETPAFHAYAKRFGRQSARRFGG